MLLTKKSGFAFSRVFSPQQQRPLAKNDELHVRVSKKKWLIKGTKNAPPAIKNPQKSFKNSATNWVSCLSSLRMSKTKSAIAKERTTYKKATGRMKSRPPTALKLKKLRKVSQL